MKKDNNNQPNVPLYIPVLSFVFFFTLRYEYIVIYDNLSKVNS